MFVIGCRPSGVRIGGDHVGIAEDPGVLLFDGLGLLTLGLFHLGFRHELGHSGLGFLDELLVGIEPLLAGDSTCDTAGGVGHSTD